MTDIEEFSASEKKKSVVRNVLYTISFNLSLILRNIRNRKRSTIIIILGLIFSLSILFTSSIWTETSQKIIADDYIETLDYEMYISTFRMNAMSPVYTFALEDSVVDQVDWIYPSIALFNFEDKGPNYRWYPEEMQENMSNPVSLSFSFVVSSRSIDRIKKNLEIEGNASLNSGEIMMSYTQAKQLEVIYNETITPGYKLNLAVTRRIPNTDIGEHTMQYYDIGETTFANYTIAGIYKYVGYNSVIDRLIGGSTASGGGIALDSIFFPMEDMNEVDLFIMDANGILPRLLIKTNAQQLRVNGIENMPDNLLALKERIEIRFYHAYCYILDQEIQTMTDEYKRAFGSLALFVPTLVSAVFLTVLSTQMTVKRRREEIAFLRSRGAVSSQIIGMFFGEFLLISVFSLVISIGLGILLAALIPSFGHEGFFSTSLFYRYFQYLEISPYDIEIYSVIVLGIYLGMTLINVITYVRRDVQESLLVTRRGQQLLSMGIKIAAFALTIAGFIFLYLDYRSIAAISYTFGFNMISASTKTLFIFIVVLFFICYFVSMGINYLLRNADKIFGSIFKKSKFFISKNIKRYTKNFTELTFFMIIIICLLTGFLTIRSTALNNISLEENYRRGADIRIQTLVPVNVTDFEMTISDISGIKNVTGFYTARASIGLQEVEIFGVNPLEYLNIGRWTSFSFVDMDPQEALTSLSANESGVILSDYVADRLGFTVGREMYVTDFRGGPFHIKLNVSAIVSSAPGLGVAHGHDPKMNRGTSEWAIITRDLFIDRIGEQNGTLFLASVDQNANIEEIAEQIRSINPLIIVNPEQINPDYIGYFIVEYIPHVTITLLIGSIFLNIIGVIYIIMSTDFILEQRRRENAVLLALGGKQTKIQKFLINELIVFLFTTIIFGIPLGIITALFALLFTKPLLISREILPMILHVDPVALLIVLFTLIIAAIIGIIPIMRKQMKYEIVHELRAIV